jgi:hypothetical protein
LLADFWHLYISYSDFFPLLIFYFFSFSSFVCSLLYLVLFTYFGFTWRVSLKTFMGYKLFTQPYTFQVC